MRRFALNRKVDRTQVSGTGIVASGWLTDGGRAILRWRSSFTSTAVYKDLESVEEIHGHQGDTVVEFDGNNDHGLIAFVLDLMAWSVDKVMDVVEDIEKKKKLRTK